MIGFCCWGRDKSIWDGGWFRDAQGKAITDLKVWKNLSSARHEKVAKLQEFWVGFVREVEMSGMVVVAAWFTIEFARKLAEKTLYEAGQSTG